MRVIKRKQVTEVVTKRTVCHTVELNGETYERICDVNVRVPYMDCKIVVSKPTIVWRKYSSLNTLVTVPKVSVNLLMLEVQFSELNIDDVNGNG